MWSLPSWYLVEFVEGKLNCTLVQALRLCTGHTAHRGSRGIALPFHDHGTRRGWGISVTLWLLFTLGKDPVPIVQEAGWAPGPVWTGAENFASTGIRSPDHPARSESLYRLNYPAHWIHGRLVKISMLPSVSVIYHRIDHKLIPVFYYNQKKIKNVMGNCKNAICLVNSFSTFCHFLLFQEFCVDKGQPWILWSDKL